MCCYAANLRLTHLTFNKGDDYRPLYSIVIFYIVCFSSLKLMIVKSRSELCHTCFFTQIFLYKLMSDIPRGKNYPCPLPFLTFFNFVLCGFFFFPFFWLVYVAWYVTCSNWSNFLSYIFITYGF